MFCVECLKDGDLICTASCDHFIHEWCVGTMKSIDDRRCKICAKNIVVYSVYKEFDLERAIQTVGVPLMIQKLDEVIKLMSGNYQNKMFANLKVSSLIRKSHDDHTANLQKNYEITSEKLELLTIEFRALKFEKKETEMRIRMLEAETQNGHEKEKKI